MRIRRRNAASPARRPALLTGTSSEYLGRRPLPRILRERPIVMVLGPAGVGKTTVALRLATPEVVMATVPRLDDRRGRIGEIVYLDAPQTQAALIERVANRRFSDRLLDAKALVLDGPVWLRDRPAAVDSLRELLNARAAVGLRTLVCQSDDDCSVEVLMGAMEAGVLAVVGLRYPKGTRGRLRFARRACDDLDIERIAARGTDLLEPWGYATVLARLGEWKETHPAVPAEASTTRRATL